MVVRLHSCFERVSRRVRGLSNHLAEALSVPVFIPQLHNSHWVSSAKFIRTSRPG